MKTINNNKEKVLRKLPWGEKIFLEIPIFKYRNQMMARYGENSEGRKYIEFSKFGPLPIQVVKEGQKTTYSQRLRLYKPSHWGIIKTIAERDLFPAIGWTTTEATVDVELSLIKNLTKQIQNNKEEAKKKDEIIAELMENISLYRDQNLKNKVPKFKNTIEEFKKLIDEEKTENYYQKFLKENYWMFGLEYVSAKSQKMAGASNRPDFSLERYDKFRDIVEIKKPQNPVFVKLRNNKVQQSPKLKEALAEVMDYIDYFLRHVNDEAIEYGENYYKPKAIIVIGRTNAFAEKIRQINSFLHRIEIITYDDLIERAEKIIAFYEK